jgi:hypothetical protein
MTKVSSVDGFRRHSREQRAIDVMIYLQQSGGSAIGEIAEALGWKQDATYRAIQHAREFVCPQLGLTIPMPVPDDGHRYRVTGDWISIDGTPAIEAGTSYAMGQVESRLRSIHRDVQVALANLEPRSIPGRKANFLNKRLTYIFDTLESIGSSVTTGAA